MDISVIHYIKNEYKFELIYSFISHTNSIRIYIKSWIKENISSIISIKNLFCSADWLEREIWDMFGIYFNLQGDLRRILTDYGFKGFPLRKNFPLTGYIELRYEDLNQMLMVEPIKSVQKFRFFKFENPWINV